MRRTLVAALLAVSLVACGDHRTGQAGAPVSVSPNPVGSARTATTDCVELAKTPPVTVPPLGVSELGNGTSRVTSAEGGYTLIVPRRSAALMTVGIRVPARTGRRAISEHHRRVAVTQHPVLAVGLNRARKH